MLVPTCIWRIGQNAESLPKNKTQKEKSVHSPVNYFLSKTCSTSSSKPNIKHKM